MERIIISVIIPAYNSELTIESCILSIINQNFPTEKYEIIVIDDGSSDNTAMIAKKAGANQVIKIRHSSSGTARNVGVNHAKGKYLAFIDSDCIAQEGWLRTIEKEMKANKVIGGPILNGKKDSIVAWAE